MFSLLILLTQKLNYDKKLFFRTFALSFVVIFLLFSCRSEEISSADNEKSIIQSSEVKSVNKISYNEMVQKLPKGTLKEDLVFSRLNENGKYLEDFDIDSTEVNQIQFGDDGTTFTMKLTPKVNNNPQEAYYNLDISQINGNIDYDIIKYNISKTTGTFEIDNSEIIFSSTGRVGCVTITVSCEYGYFHSDAECIGSGSHSYTICSSPGGSPETGGDGHTTPTGFPIGDSNTGGGSGSSYAFIFYKYLTTQQRTWLDTHGNIAANFDLYVDSNEYSEKSIAFAKWGVNFFLQNPNTTWAQFQNWFMGTSEGKAGEDYDTTFWDNPNLTFPQQNLPSWQNYFDGFPKDANGNGLTGPQVYTLIGGTPLAYRNGVLNDNDPTNDRDYDNACALRVSRALNYSGVIIPQITGQTFKGADGKYYFKAAYQINLWTRKTFGTNPASTSNPITPYNPNHHQYNQSQAGVHGINLPNLLNGMHGIYSIYSSDFNWASGHADLLNSDATCGNHCLFYEAPIFRLDIWELP